MPRLATIVSIFLASPSDVAPERALISRCVAEWNQINGNKQLLFDVIKWENSIAAGFGTDGQDVINRQVPDYDVLIALFWNRLGTATPRSVSGTAEEYERALARLKNNEAIEIAFYFKDKAVNLREVELDQVQAVQDFEKRVQNEGALSKQFTDDESLRFEINLLLDKMARKFSENLPKKSNELVSIEISTPSEIFHDETDKEELGLFDIIENIEKHAGNATSSLSIITNNMNYMTKIVGEVTQEMGDIAKIRLINPEEAKPLIAKLCTGMNDFSAALESEVVVFAENSFAMANDIRATIDVSYDFVPSHESPLEILLPFRLAVVAILQNTDSAKEGFLEMIQTVSGLQRTTSQFNQSKRRLVKNINIVIDSFSSIKALMSQGLQELDELIASI